MSATLWRAARKIVRHSRAPASYLTALVRTNPQSTSSVGVSGESRAPQTARPDHAKHVPLA